MKTFSRPPLTLRIAEGSLEPIEGWVSNHYGQREKAPLLSSSTIARLPLRLMTVLLPARNANDAPPPLTPMNDAAGNPFGLRFDRTTHTIRFDDDGLHIEGGSWKA